MCSATLGGLTQSLNDAEALVTPALTSVPAGSSLASLIADRGDAALPPLSSNNITGEWLGKLMARLQGMSNRLKRVHFKSLGSLLACQEKLVGEWKSTPLSQVAPPAVASNTLGPPLIDFSHLRQVGRNGRLIVIADAGWWP
jgi:hypothetical protein